MSIFIPSKKQIQNMIWDDYVYEPMTKEDILFEQNTKVGGWFGERNGMYGKTITEEHKEAIRQGVLKHKPWLKTPRSACVKGGHASKIGERSRKAIIIDGKHYNSMKEAHEKLNIHPATISHRVRSKAFPHYKYNQV